MVFLGTEVLISRDYAKGKWHERQRIVVIHCPLQHKHEAAAKEARRSHLQNMSDSSGNSQQICGICCKRMQWRWKILQGFKKKLYKFSEEKSFKNFWKNRNNLWLRDSITESSRRTSIKWNTSKIYLVSMFPMHPFFWDGSCEELGNFWVPGQDFLFYGNQTQNTRQERTTTRVIQWANSSRIHLKLFIKHNLKQNISIKI